MKIIKEIITIILTIFLGLLPNIIDMGWFLSLIINWPRVVFFIIVLLIVIIFCLLNKNLFKDKNDYPIKTSHIKQWKHSILICDDKNSDLATISDQLKGNDFDFVTVKDLSDYRLAECFEIIICDIWGVGPAKTSISVLNTIKEKYPYKIVVAMSAVSSRPSDLRNDIEFITKDKAKTYAKTISNNIKEYSAKLDDIDKHWAEINDSLKRQTLDSLLISKHKKNYYNYISNLKI